MYNHLAWSSFSRCCSGCHLIVCIYGSVILPTLSFYKLAMVSVSQEVSARQVAYTQSQTDTLSVSTGYVADPPMHTPYATVDSSAGGRVQPHLSGNQRCTWCKYLAVACATIIFGQNVAWTCCTYHFVCNGLSRNISTLQNSVT